MYTVTFDVKRAGSRVYGLSHKDKDEGGQTLHGTLVVILRGMTPLMAQTLERVLNQVCSHIVDHLPERTQYMVDALKHAFALLREGSFVLIEGGGDRHDQAYVYSPDTKNAVLINAFIDPLAPEVVFRTGGAAAAGRMHLEYQMHATCAEMDGDTLATKIAVVLDPRCRGTNRQ